MNRLICIIIALALLNGCGDKRPRPAGRLKQKSGEFSFVTPNGWFRSKVPGLDFIIVATESDQGTEPNIFVDFVAPNTKLDQAVDSLTDKYKKNHQSYKIVGRSNIQAVSGLRGVKMTAYRNDGQQRLISFHYLVQDTDRVIAITCTCAKSMRQKYEPKFDASMKSLESERK